MNQEDRELLLKDLCARLPYGVFCNMGLEYPLPLQRIFVDRLDGILLDFYEDGEDYQVYLSEVKPYLRPMSSMILEEKKEFNKVVYDSMNIDNIPASVYVADWLYSKHLDVHGLIPKGLALEVTPDNNPYKV